MVFPVILSLNPGEDDAKLLEFSKRSEGCSSRASRLAKTFPDVPILFRASCGSPESRLGIPMGLEIGKG